MFRIVLFIYMTTLIGNISTIYSSKQIEGYTYGFLSDCPGSNKEAVITKRSLKYLTLTVARKSQALNMKYNYYEMKYLAKDPVIDFSKKTVLFASGYLDSPNFGIATYLGKFYLNLDYNVLLLDTNYFSTREYQRAARLMRAVGKSTAEMLAELVELGLDPKRLELIGISLGGQTASFIAKYFKRTTGTTVSRLTGLDPAGPCFRNLGPDDRIDRSDADYVEIISTNIDGYGMAAPVGHINYYVNGGEYQPGALMWNLCNILCSHTRSLFIWVAAIQNPNSFIAIKCDSVQQARDRKCYDRQPMETAVLELVPDRSKEGIYYLSTDQKYPYYMGEKGLLKENDFFLSHSTVNDAILKV